MLSNCGFLTSRIVNNIITILKSSDSPNWTRMFTSNQTYLFNLTFAPTITTNSKNMANLQDPDQMPADKLVGADRIYVNSYKNGELMSISFNVHFDNKPKQFNLTRKPDDLLSSTFERIRLNLLKANKKLKKNNKKFKDSYRSNEPADKFYDNNQISDISKVELSIEGETVDPSITKNIDAWIDGASLKILGKTYQISTDNPAVESIELPRCIMQTFPCIPLVKLINCSLIDCKYEWFRRVSRQDRDALMNEEEKSKVVCDEYSTLWYKLSDQMVYYPTKDDIARQLKIICWPTDGRKHGPCSTAICGTPVEVGPRECPFEKRHKLTENKLTDCPKEFRVVSYNILADLYADSDYSRDHLFAHCPPSALLLDYRRPLLMKELMGYNGDIYCLQEVDRKEYERVYQAFFKMACKCSSVFNTKGGTVAEGPATFFSDEKFELITSHRTILSELIQAKNEAAARTEANLEGEESGEKKSNQSRPLIEAHCILDPRDSPIAQKCLENFRSIRASILSNPELSKRFLDRHTVLQATLLRVKNSTTPNYILVGNTHLYFAADADHVRLLQASVCIKYLEFLRDYYATMLMEKGIKDPHISVLLCGDMNSTMNCGLYKLAHEGFVGKDFPDWSSNKDEAVVDLEVKTNLRFSSAYQDIEYTNYTPLFNGCLDYIYYERDQLMCESTIPLPDHKDVIAMDGIPSDVFPSDHLALIANLKFK